MSDPLEKKYQECQVTWPLQWLQSEIGARNTLVLPP